MTGLHAPLPGGGALLTTGYLSCTGDATVLTLRGKLRHGFDFQLSVTFTATLPATADLDVREVKGTLQIQDASRDAVQVRPSCPPAGTADRADRADAASFPQSDELELVVDVVKPSLKAAKATEAEIRGIAAAAKGAALHAQLLAALKTLDAEMLARVTQS